MMIFILQGVIGVIVFNMIFNVSVAYLYPELNGLSAIDQMRDYPVQYMFCTYIPFQVGLFLFPGVVFFYFKKQTNQLNYTSFSLKKYSWSFTIFLLLVFLLPFLTLVNSKVLDFFGSLDLATKQINNYQESLSYLIGSTASRDSYLTGLIIIGVLVPICEEFFFRGFILAHIKKTKESAWIAIILSALFFALMHFNWYQLFPILSFGLVLGIIYQLCNSLIPGIILHALNNILNVYWVRNNNFPSILEEYHVIPSTIYIVLFVSLIALYHKNLKFKA